jgi:hypothetical protein
MKKAVALLFIFVSTASYADEVCGLLQSKVEAPVCNPGAPCPAFMRLVYTITPTNGTPVVVSTLDFQVLNDLEIADNTNVCVEGQVADGNIVAAAIKTQ